MLPAEFFAVKVTVYFPALLYLCEGLLSFEVLLSPKSQRYDVGDPVLLSVNLTVFPDTLVLNAATGAFAETEAFAVEGFEAATVIDFYYCVFAKPYHL